MNPIMNPIISKILLGICNSVESNTHKVPKIIEANRMVEINLIHLITGFLFGLSLIFME